MYIYSIVYSYICYYYRVYKFILMVNWKGSLYVKILVWMFVSRIERIFKVCNWINCVWF